MHPWFGFEERRQTTMVAPSRVGGASRYRRAGSSNRLSSEAAADADAATYSTVPPVVVEFGSSCIRVGISGEAAPRRVVPTPPSLSRLPACPDLKTPAQWDGVLYPLLSSIATEHLLLKNLRSRRVLILEPTLVAPASFRDSICRVLLRYLSCPAVLFVPGPASIVLPYGLGLAHGLIVDVGAWEGRVACVGGGASGGSGSSPLLPTVRFAPCGLNRLAGRLMEVCNGAADGGGQTSAAPIPSVEDGIGVLNAFFSHPSSAPTTTPSESNDVELTVPSTEAPVRVDARMVSQILHEMYFDVANPESLAHALLSSLSSCPIDLRRQVASSVVFVGGAVDFIPKFEERMVRSLAETLGEQESGQPTEAVAASCSSFRSLRPLVQVGLGVVYPLPFAPSVMAWTAASVYGTMELPADEMVLQRAFLAGAPKKGMDGQEDHDRAEHLAGAVTKAKIGSSSSSSRQKARKRQDMWRDYLSV